VEKFTLALDYLRIRIRRNQRGVKMGNYKKVIIEAGKGGWGGPLEVLPTDKKKYIQ
jgi:hypothetical protein